ncbi:MAG TPA: TIGR01777 family oxidoreductase, partial [Ignavibacteriaceae bacterium]|nr:TIGR01777 family oxidoreductase [Ignavibacteriaceae bacterium]
MSKIIITGATGMIGQDLCRILVERKDEIIVFTRNVDRAKTELPFVKHFVEWNYKKPENWQNEIDGSDVVIHLAGANLFGRRWNDKYKKIILESREIGTRNIVETIKKAKKKPEALICSSGINIYSDSGNETLTEKSDLGKDFLAEVCKRWEDEAEKVEEVGVRRVSLRTGVVLDKNEGALKKMLLPFKLFIGGPLGSGKQWFSWIHKDDILNIIIISIDNKNIKGPVNASSPNPVTMNQFAKTLGKVLHRPAIFKVPEFALKIAVGEGAVSIVSSLRIKPQKLIRN